MMDATAAAGSYFSCQTMRLKRLNQQDDGGQFGIRAKAPISDLNSLSVRNLIALMGEKEDYLTEKLCSCHHFVPFQTDLLS